MPIQDIEDKLDYIVTEIIGLNYKLEEFVAFLTETEEGASLQSFLENDNLSALNRVVENFKKQADLPEPYDGAARFTEDILKTIDLHKYPVFKEHPHLISEAEREIKEEPKIVIDTVEEPETLSNLGNKSIHSIEGSLNKSVGSVNPLDMSNNGGKGLDLDVTPGEGLGSDSEGAEAYFGAELEELPAQETEEKDSNPQEKDGKE